LIVEGQADVAGNPLERQACGGQLRCQPIGVVDRQRAPTTESGISRQIRGRRGVDRQEMIEVRLQAATDLGEPADRSQRLVAVDAAPDWLAHVVSRPKMITSRAQSHPSAG
jgi:hypothetical protein